MLGETIYQAETPHDLSRRVFLELRDNAGLRKQYDEAIGGKDGRPDPKARAVMSSPASPRNASGDA
jgi:hypothetical protein